MSSSLAGTAAAGRPARIDVTEYGWRRVFVTLAVIMGALLEILDTTIVNVALPQIQGNVGATQDEGTFIVTGYIVANVVVIPLSPWLQQRFGRKQYFFSSILIFTIASIMCGLSHDLWSLVFWRVVQGAGGGGLLSQAQAILRETFPAKQQELPSRSSPSVRSSGRPSVRCSAVSSRTMCRGNGVSLSTFQLESLLGPSRCSICAAPSRHRNPAWMELASRSWPSGSAHSSTRSTKARKKIGSVVR